MRLRKILSGTSLVILLTGCPQPSDRVAPVTLDPLSDRASTVARSLSLTPLPPWHEGDQRGMANTLGPGSWLRCARHLAQEGTRVYELSHLRSNDMPQSPWVAPERYEYLPTVGRPGSIDASNLGELVIGGPGAQGTQMDAFGHWGYLAEPWDGAGEFPAADATYYGGFKQAEVKPSPDSPLLKLGIDQVPPIVTSAVLLDARTHVGGGKPMQAGQLVNAADIERMIEAQGLAWRGLLPGDVLYIYTGWGEYWSEEFYYDMGPGLSYDAARYLEDKRIVLVALDNPFTDAVNEGQFFDGVAPPESTPTKSSAPVHYHNLTQAGIHNIQNANLAEIAQDRVWTSCTIILPLRVKGGSGSPVRPIAIGVPMG